MKRVAVLVGRNGPSDSELDGLRFVHNDTERLKKALLASPASFDSVIVADRAQRPSDVLEAFEAVAAGCSYNDCLLFYFSGHGMLQRGQLYLVWDSTDLSRLVSTSLPIAQVKSVFANAKTKVKLLVLDCCHSGAAGEAQFAKGTTISLGLPLVEAARDSASLIISACGRNAVTREIQEFTSGYLTHLLVEALSGRFEDADRDRDGLLSVQEFLEWASQFTASWNESGRSPQRIDPPELYGDFRSAVYLTAHRVSYNDDFNQKLHTGILADTAKVRNAFSEHKWLDFKKLESLARPLRRVAPTLTDLRILDELLKTGDSAAIFSAAVILQLRRDPMYMERLILHVDNQELRGAANWRVLRAIRDTLPTYHLTESGHADLVHRLQRAAIERQTRRGDMFSKGTALHMIEQIRRRLKVPREALFTRAQIAALQE